MGNILKRGTYFIRIDKEDGDWFNKDLLDASIEERKVYFEKLNKEELLNIIDLCLEDFD